MTLGLIIFTTVIISFCLYAYWTLYQLTLAAWGSKKAKPQWIAIVESPAGQLLLPISKWLLPTAGLVFVISVIYHLLGGSYAT